MLLCGLVVFLLLLTAEARVGDSENVSFCTETKECLQFEPVCEGQNYEVRHYDSAKWVTTEYASFFLDYATIVAFRRLFKYIKENNVEMTSPVLMKMQWQKSSIWEREALSMSFLLPSAHQANPPAPADELVKIVQMPAVNVYVSSFNGWMMAYTAKKKAKALADALESVGAKYRADDFYAVGYNSPMTMFNRHNEVWLEVQGAPVCPNHQDMD